MRFNHTLYLTSKQNYVAIHEIELKYVVRKGKSRTFKTKLKKIIFYGSINKCCAYIDISKGSLKNKVKDPLNCCLVPFSFEKAFKWSKKKRKLVTRLAWR